ncbi:MAG: mevalonate kinase [Anaerolineales bacterium]|nr:mevalonate kinase [Anaerolineales bacterium]
MTALRAAMASAPGKAILLGEHAVVYGRPALAVPVTLVQATATFTPAPGDFWIEAPALRQRYRLAEAAPDDVLALAVNLALQAAGGGAAAGVLRVESNIPLAAGLGSGAAVCTAVVRAMALALGHALDDAAVSALVYETEKRLHGTPSGIDNTVVAYARPVYFVRGQAPVPLAVRRPLHLLIADTGRPSLTRETVGAVRAGYEQDPPRYTALFDEIAGLVERARAVIEGAAGEALGPLLTRNQALLAALGVSTPALEALAAAALAAGAQGAKLSGGGGGGNLIALVTPGTAAPVEAALRAAGAVRVWASRLGPEAAQA